MTARRTLAALSFVFLALLAVAAPASASCTYDFDFAVVGSQVQVTVQADCPGQPNTVFLSVTPGFASTSALGDTAIVSVARQASPTVYCAQAVATYYEQAYEPWNPYPSFVLVLDEGDSACESL